MACNGSGTYMTITPPDGFPREVRCPGCDQCQPPKETDTSNTEDK
jgi:hypothetical protein